MSPDMLEYLLSKNVINTAFGMMVDYIAEVSASISVSSTPYQDVISRLISR